MVQNAFGSGIKGSVIRILFRTHPDTLRAADIPGNSVVILIYING